MRTLVFYLKLYFQIVGQFLKTRMQYKADFFISTFGMVLWNVGGLVSLRILMMNFPTIAGWDYNQLVFIYSFSVLVQVPLQIVFDNIWSLRSHLNQGTFIKYYFKPIHSLFYYVSETIDLKGFGQLAFGIASFVWASSSLGIQWTPERVVLLPILMLGASLILVSLMLIAASGCFWVKDSFSILAFVSSFRDHSKYPIGIFNAAFRFIFTWIIPVGFIAYYPSLFYVGDEKPDWISWITPVFGAALFWLAIKVWHRGMRAWGGTGS